ncbi:MAG: hypothetical protein JWO53_1175 [Chlamydiia bacterium]|nr:hypothetical protein [Chlamydiia bacterium]
MSFLVRGETDSKQVDVNQRAQDTASGSNNAHSASATSTSDREQDRATDTNSYEYGEVRGAKYST